MKHLLKVENVTKYYGRTKGIENLSFELNPSEIIGLCGHNGSGKTTLFRVILGLLTATEGNIYYGSEFESLSTYFGYMPEERSMYKDITIQQLLEYLGKLKNMDRQQIEYAIFKWLKFFALETQKHRKLQELSKGNQQKVQFICALIHDPKILILDEPLTGLDSVNVQVFKEAMRMLIQQKKAVILSSHKYEELEQFCDKIILLKQGHQIINSTLKDLKQKYQKRYIWVNRDAYLDEIEVLGELKREAMDNYLRFIIDHEANARHVIDDLNQMASVTYLRKEMISLRDLILEASEVL